MTKLLLTGASGFVGSHILEHVLLNTNWDVVCPITQQHHGAIARVYHSDHWKKHSSRVQIINCDLSMPITKQDAFNLFTGVSLVWHLAADSHVDRSITDPAPFITNNVAVTLNLLEALRKGNWFQQMTHIIQFSTDEVYGPADSVGDNHKEWAPIMPSNPYSASKACQEAIAFSFWRTYGLPIIITNTMNVFGERQDPEKFIPKCIRNFMAGKPVDVHCAPDGTPGSRYYIHARNVADALLYITKNLTVQYYNNSRGSTSNCPRRFNIVGELEVDNVTLALKIADVCNEYNMDNNLMGVRHVPDFVNKVSFHATRPGHDLRYGLDGSKLAELGWRPPKIFEDSLRKTVKWALQHPEWL